MPQTIDITDELARLRAENARLRSFGLDLLDELAALRTENARLKADIAIRPGSLSLLYRIREAAGLNQYCDLSDLPDHVCRMRASLLEITEAGRSIWGPFETERAIHRARKVARGTGDVPQAAE